MGLLGQGQIVIQHLAVYYALNYSSNAAQTTVYMTEAVPVSGDMERATLWNAASQLASPPPIHHPDHLETEY